MSAPPDPRDEEIASLRGRLSELAATNEALEREIAERRAADDAGRQSGQVSHLLIDGIPGLVAVLGPTGEVQAVNRRILDFCGCPLEELKEWASNGIVHAEDLPHVADVFGRSIATGSSYAIEQRLRRFDREYRWFLNCGAPVRDASGGIAYWYVLLTDIDDLKRAEQALKERERNLRSIIDGIPGFIALASPQGELLVANRQMTDYFGATVEELKPWGDYVHEADLPAVFEKFGASIGSGLPFDVEHRLQRADGVFRWFSSRGLPYRDEAGKIAGWYFLLTDIDEMKRVEDALRRSEKNARLLVDSIPAGAALMTPNGELEIVNKQIVDYFGRSFEELKGWMANTETIHPDDYPRMVAAAQHSLATGELFDIEERLRRSDGVYRWFNVRGLPVRDADGQIVRWYILHIDINERKQAEAELRQASHHLNAAQRLSRTGSYTADLVRDEHTWSDEFYRICEFDRDSPVTISRLQDIVHPDDVPAYLNAISRALEGVEPDFEFRIVTASGVIKHLRGLARREDLPDRPLFVGAVQDVSDRKLAEEARDKARSELEHASRAMSLGVLAASIAHEVNQPLSGVITNADTALRMLSADPPDIEGARKTARRTIRDGDRAAEVIARLRALFGRKEIAAESLDLNGVAREIIGLSSRELQRRRISVHAEYDETLPRVTGDRVQLQQVILNFLLNASDAMQGIDDRPREIFIKTTRANGNAVKLTVRDTGVGLPGESLGRLFDAFYTTKPDGMGIGLSVSRSIVERHRGRLWAEQNDGPGATFSFSIPCESNAESAIRDAEV